MVKMKLQLTKFQVMGLFVLHDKYSTNIEKFIISKDTLNYDKKTKSIIGYDFKARMNHPGKPYQRLRHH